MKKLLGLIALTAMLTLGMQTRAAVAVFSLTGPLGTDGTNTLALATPGVINTLTIATGTNTIVRLYDSAYETLWWTNAAYTNYQTYLTNLITTTIMPSGLTNVSTNLTLFTAVTLTAAGSNAVPPFFTAAVAAGDVQTYTLGSVVTKALYISNTIPCTVILDSRAP